MKHLAFPKMHEKLRPKKRGEEELIHYTVSQHESIMATLRRDYVSPGKYAVLRLRGTVVMSDTDMERNSNREVVHRAHGRVLIAGLGIGMILHPILKKSEVKSVTVIENSADVIALVGKSVTHRKLTIIQADIHHWRPQKDTKYNTIYFDIWPNRCEDNLPEMARLHQAFKKFKDRHDPNCWMESWSRQELKAAKRSSYRSLWRG